MLSKEQNERLTRVGPGTPMGTLMRRYWHPIATSAELPHPDCDPLRLGLLGPSAEATDGQKDRGGDFGLLMHHCSRKGWQAGVCHTAKPFMCPPGRAFGCRGFWELVRKMTDSGKPLKPEITHAEGHGLGLQVLVEKGIFWSCPFSKSRLVRRIANKKSQFTFLDLMAIDVSAAAIIKLQFGDF